MREVLLDYLRYYGCCSMRMSASQLGRYTIYFFLSLSCFLCFFFPPELPTSLVCGAFFCVAASFFAIQVLQCGLNCKSGWDPWLWLFFFLEPFETFGSSLSLLEDGFSSLSLSRPLHTFLCLLRACPDENTTPRHLPHLKFMQ